MARGKVKGFMRKNRVSIYALCTCKTYTETTM